MNNENLTQIEAEERSGTIKVDSYDVHVDLTHASEADFKTYPTATTVKFSAHEGASTFIDYIHHSIDSVKLNGQHLNIHEVVEGSRIQLPNLAENNVLTIMGRSYYSRSGEGLHRYFDPQDGRVYLYTQYEPADCRRVFPNFEQPDLKAVFNFRITAPKNWVVSSNAELEKEIDDPADSSVSKRVFKPTERISTYITTLLAGEYHVETDLYQPKASTHSGNIPLKVFCRRSLSKYFDAENIFRVTKQGLDFFQDLFDFAYPFHKYEQAFVPEYNLGAMENPGLVTFTERYIFESGATEAQLEGRANVICHEMSHMWFGDLVTMKWWNDLWLKESFAEFMGTLGAERANGFDQAWVTFANSRKAWAYTQDQLPTTHPIVADIPHLEAARQNFDGITYAKGSSVLKQLVAYVGYESFIEAARLYFKRHAWGNTTLDDFIAVLDEVSDRDIRVWAQAWLQTSGLSSFSTERRIGQDGSLLEFALCQQLPVGVDSAVGRPHQLKIETFVEQDGGLQSSGKCEAEIPAGDSSRAVLALEAHELKQLETADVTVINAEDLTYAKVILSAEDGLDQALSGVSSIEDPLTRGMIWGSLWNQVRDAKLATNVFVEAVGVHASREKSATLLANLLNQAQGAIANYTAAEQRQELWDSLYQAVAGALEQAQPKSDEQLILLRALLAISAQTDLGLDVCQEVKQGAFGGADDISCAPGISCNQTLGWSALIALAARAAVGIEELKQARGVASSATSERGWAYAVHAFPTAEAKAAAYRAVTEDQELSNEILSATAQGFQTGENSLRAEYLSDYFGRLEEIWDSRSIGMATRIVSGLYPKPTFVAGQGLDQELTICAAKKWLEEHPNSPTALQREIREELDSAQRMLRAQKFNSEFTAC